ncbi:MAG: nucleoside-diphosphate kinase [Lysinibacillus sp.]|nr:nucleoside-diphosphate kinase [Lysinibacillus sp.]
MAIEKTFIMVKPDGVERQVVGDIIDRFERRGFVMRGAKLMNVPRELAEKHYEEHKDKPFFGELVDFITSGPVFAMVWEGESIIKLARIMMGATKPEESQPGTIRGDYAVTISQNVIHGSDSPASAEREINLWFNNELV